MKKEYALKLNGYDYDINYTEVNNETIAKKKKYNKIHLV